MHGILTLFHTRGLDKTPFLLYNSMVIGVWLSLARAPALGAGRRRFESCHPDQQRNAAPLSPAVSSVGDFFAREGLCRPSSSAFSLPKFSEGKFQEENPLVYHLHSLQ